MFINLVKWHGLLYYLSYVDEVKSVHNSQVTIYQFTSIASTTLCIGKTLLNAQAF